MTDVGGAAGVGRLLTATIEEIQTEARIQQIRSLDDIEWVVLEPNGSLSFIER